MSAESIGRVTAESIGRVSPFPGGSDRLPQDEAGRLGDRRSPLRGAETVAGIQDRLARPV
ncbi:MAG: hypothetical protein ABSF48_17860 [Thermodesulfobacteriota bacterium]